MRHEDECGAGLYAEAVQSRTRRRTKEDRACDPGTSGRGIFAHHPCLGSNGQNIEGKFPNKYAEKERRDVPRNRHARHAQAHARPEKPLFCLLLFSQHARQEHHARHCLAKCNGVGQWSTTTPRCCAP